MPKTKKKFYITTAIPYVNSVPHLGFALEVVQADVLARYRRLKGDNVFFLTGTDENALKNVLQAREQGIKVESLVDKNAAEFRKLKEVLNLSWDDFIRTTEERHKKGAQKFWLACSKDIYKKKYRGLYCVGCEEFKTAKELVENRCPEHPKAELETIEEENYFFRLSAYQKALEGLISSGKLKIIPDSRKNEILSFIRSGLEDFSISRSKERSLGWGIGVPNDDAQIIYVWFDALLNYLTAIGYGYDEKKFNKWWPADLHVIGKGITRFHAVYWPAMLLSAGFALHKKIFVHGYLTIDGQKISKSLGNIVNPADLVKKYGADSVRYYLLREIPPTEDGDFSFEKFEASYNTNLAGGIGNLVARVLAIARKANVKLKISNPNKAGDPSIGKNLKKVEEALNKFQFSIAVVHIWDIIRFCDRYIESKKLWENPELQKSTIVFLLGVLSRIAVALKPFLPETSEKIIRQLRGEKGELLFPKVKG